MSVQGRAGLVVPALACLMLGYDHGTAAEGSNPCPTTSGLHVDTTGILSLYMCEWMTNAADGKELGGVWEITGLWHRGETPRGKYWEVGTLLIKSCLLL